MSQLYVVDKKQHVTRNSTKPTYKKKLRRHEKTNLPIFVHKYITFEYHFGGKN